MSTRWAFCAYVTVLELWANLPFMSQGENETDCGAKAKAAVGKLAQYTVYPSARHGRACYFDFVGQVDDARREWTAIKESAAGGYMQAYYAAFEYRHGDRPRAMELVRKSSEESVLSAIHYGEMLALERNKESDARDIYSDISTRLKPLSIGPDDFVGVPETILLLLGDTEGAAKQAAARATSSGQLPWQRAMLDFLATPDMSAETLLASATRTYDRVVAHKLIAYRHLSRGEVELAENHLTKCVQAFFWQPDAYWANAVLSRLKTDTAWREWLRTRRSKQ